MTSFPPSFFDHLSDRLQLAVYDTNQELRTRRLTGLLREAEMNIRLRDLMASREKHTTPLPLVEMNMPASPVTERKPMSVLGMPGGQIEAAIEKAKQRLVAKHAEGLAKIEGATSSAEAKIEGVTANLAAKIEKEIEDQVSGFVTLTNGGPV